MAIIDNAISAIRSFSDQFLNPQKTIYGNNAKVEPGLQSAYRALLEQTTQQNAPRQQRQYILSQISEPTNPRESFGDRLTRIVDSATGLYRKKIQPGIDTITSNIDPTNYNTPLFGGIRRLSADTFGTPSYLKPLNQQTPEEQLDLATSFSPLGMGTLGKKIAKGAAAKLAKGIEPKLAEAGSEVGEFLDSLSPLRKTRPGSYTNVRALDNPMVQGIDFVEEMANEARRLKDKPFKQLVSQAVDGFADLKKKVNLLDMLRTPDRVLQKIGLGQEAADLRKAWDGYKVSLPAEIQKITDWSKRVGPGANERIFNFLDGKLKTLDNPTEQQVAKEIRQYLQGWTQQLGLPRDRQISNYITHLFDKGKIEKEFDPEIAQVIRGKISASVYDPFLQQRVDMPEYRTDTWAALDAYVKRAARKVALDPTLERIAAKAENLPTESYNYVKSHVARINMQPTDIDNLVDNLVKSSPIGYSLGQRPTTVVTQRARQMIFRGLLGLNPGSALRNLQQASNVYAVVGERNFGIGLIKTLQNLPRYIAGKDTELERLGVLGQDIIQDRTINATKKFWEKTDNVLFYMFNQAEKILRSIAFYGGKAQALSKGMSEEQAVDLAKSIVRKTQFSYDTLDTPAVIQSDIMKTLFQFGKYPLAQTEFLVEMVKDKNIVGSLRWLASNLLFIAAAGKVLGLEPQDMFPQFRFGVPPTLQAGAGLLQVATGQEDKFGNPAEPNLLKRAIDNKDLTRGLVNYVPAGGQLRKMYEGTQAINEGGSYTPSSRLRYPVEGNLQNVLLGTNTSQQASDYYNNGVSPLGDKQTQLYQQLIDSGMKPQQAYEAIIQQRAKDNKFDSLLNTNNTQPTNKGFDLFGLFGNNEQKTEPTQTESDIVNDPLLELYQTESQADEKSAKIKEIYKLGLPADRTQALLEQAGITTEEAQTSILKSLSLENKSRYLQQQFQGLDNEEFKAKMSDYVSVGIMTSGVVTEWKDNQDITDDQAKGLNAMIKSLQGKAPAKAKTSGGKRKRSFTIPKVTASSKPKKLNIKVPKFLPLKPLKPGKISTTQRNALLRIATGGSR